MKITLNIFIICPYHAQATLREGRRRHVITARGFSATPDNLINPCAVSQVLLVAEFDWTDVSDSVHAEKKY